MMPRITVGWESPSDIQTVAELREARDELQAQLEAVQAEIESRHERASETHQTLGSFESEAD